MEKRGVLGKNRESTVIIIFSTESVIDEVQWLNHKQETTGC